MVTPRESSLRAMLEKCSISCLEGCEAPGPPNIVKCVQVSALSVPCASRVLPFALVWSRVSRRGTKKFSPFNDKSK